MRISNAQDEYAETHKAVVKDFVGRFGNKSVGSMGNSTNYYAKVSKVISSMLSDSDKNMIIFETHDSVNLTGALMDNYINTDRLVNAILKKNR